METWFHEINMSTNEESVTGIIKTKVSLMRGNITEKKTWSRTIRPLVSHVRSE